MLTHFSSSGKGWATFVPDQLENSTDWMSEKDMSVVSAGPYIPTKKNIIVFFLFVQRSNFRDFEFVDRALRDTSSLQLMQFVPDG